MSTRAATRSFAAAFAATLVLTGCGPGESAPEDAGTQAPPPENARHWVLVDSDQGAALVLLGEGDRQVLHLACLAEPARMQVIASDFTVIGSEERLTLGVAGEAFGLVADVEREGPGVQAEAAIDPAFLEHLARAPDISAVYGAQQIGPYPGPGEGERSAFVQRCAGLANAG